MPSVLEHPVLPQGVLEEMSLDVYSMHNINLIFISTDCGVCRLPQLNKIVLY